MKPMIQTFRPVIPVVLCALVVSASIALSAHAAELVLSDGRIIEGRMAELSSLGDAQMLTDAGGGKMIVFADDQLRRTFVPRSPLRLREVRLDEAGAAPVEEFHIRQRSTEQGRTVAAVGPILRTTPFDEFGRRIIRMNTRGGPVDVVQGITTITPEWTKVEGITHVWDMRVATSSLPSDTLDEILRKQTDPDNLEHYKKIARFYLQAEQYREALGVLQAAIEAFPQRDDLKAELEPSIRSIRQLSARRLLDELRLRREAGQHRLAFSGLQQFPSEGVAGEMLQAVREMLDEYAEWHAQGKRVFEQLEQQLAAIPDQTTRDNLRPACEEIRQQLRIGTLSRMDAFRQNLDDPALEPEQKLALALSGWLIGSDRATPNLAVALSLYNVRRLLREYLNEPTRPNRELIFTKLGSEEGATPTLIAALLAHMRPPGELPEPVSEEKPGYYEVEVNALPGHPPVKYLVQTPPEYDPLRLYPTVFTLHGAGTKAERQVDWWAGAWNARHQRAGQAARHGYIVVAPDWKAENQTEYGYSAREHASVLAVLRDACRRFSIDTDRVFLSGHSMGGDAAWDIGLAHPDLWAGVIPIVANADRYCAFYTDNAEELPMYFIFGEKDGSARMTENASELDHYFRRVYDVTVVQYRGRGHEDFYSEVLRLFDWMGRQRRNFFPREIECVTMRRFDNFFWWVELDGLPEAAVVDPVDWPPGRGTRPLGVKASITATGNVRVQTGASNVTVWLAPEMIDFGERSLVIVNGRRINGRQPFIQPDLRVLLEDARTRADRQHPFWAKVEAHTGR